MHTVSWGCIYQFPFLLLYGGAVPTLNFSITIQPSLITIILSYIYLSSLLKSNNFIFHKNTSTGFLSLFIYDGAVPAHKYCPRSGNQVYIGFRKVTIFLYYFYLSRLLKSYNFFLFHIMLNRFPLTVYL